MKTNSKKWISFMLVLALMFSLSVPAFAAESIEEQRTPITAEMANTFSEMAEIASKCVDVTDVQEKATYIDVATALVSEDNLTVNAGKNNLDFNKVNVIKGAFDGKNYVFVNIAITGKYSTLSNLNLMLDDANNLVYYSETLIENNPEINKFVVSNYQNGTVIERKQTDIDFISNDQIQTGIDGLKKASLENNVTTRGALEAGGCLAAVLGVNGVVGKLIFATCVAACTAEPIGATVCAACIGGVCAIGAADIGAIVGCFKL